MTAQRSLLQARIEPSLKAAFEAHAQAKNLKPSELLRRLVLAELGMQAELPELNAPPGAKSLKVERVMLRLPSFMYAAVRVRAAAKGMVAARWISSLVQSHLAQEPVMTEKEVQMLRAMNRELAAIGRNVNQIAKALNSAVGDIERGRVSLEDLDKVPSSITVSRKIITNLIRKSQQSWSAIDED